MSRITAIETYVSRRLCVVKVITDDGREGFGQTAPSEPEITAEVLHRLVARHFLGGSPWEVGALVDRAVRAEYKYLGAFLLRAISGIDTALWDLQGKLAGQPVYRLLGGKVRDRVPVYASSMSREPAGRRRGGPDRPRGAAVRPPLRQDQDRHPQRPGRRALGRPHRGAGAGHAGRVRATVSPSAPTPTARTPPPVPSPSAGGSRSTACSIWRSPTPVGSWTT